MTEPTDGEIGTALGAAIQGVITDLEHGVVVKWVALVETVGPDGERGVWQCASVGNKRWDTVGMLRHAIDSEYAVYLARHLKKDDDE